MMPAEDYRVKNAREGKAIYIPGKSVEEMREILASEKAAKAKAPGKGQTFIIDLTEAEWAAIDTGIPDVIEALYDAKNICDLLADGMASGFLSNDDRLGIYKPMFSEMGRDASTHPDELIFALLKAGFESDCFDGQNFFDTDHPID